MTKFKIGDRVKISNDSEFNWQSKSCGIIDICEYIHDNSIEFPYHVTFEDGDKNWYRGGDLVLAKKTLIETIRI